MFGLVGGEGEGEGEGEGGGGGGLEKGWEGEGGRGGGGMGRRESEEPWCFQFCLRGCSHRNEAKF